MYKKSGRKFPVAGPGFSPSISEGVSPYSGNGCLAGSLDDGYSSRFAMRIPGFIQKDSSLDQRNSLLK